jgi:hypothetical protein
MLLLTKIMVTIYLANLMGVNKIGKKFVFIQTLNPYFIYF